MLVYDYIEYQHLKIHLFSNDGPSPCDRTIPKLIKNTVRKYHDRVLDIFYDDVDHPISRYLYAKNIRPRIASCHKTYFRTRFHPMNEPHVIQEESGMLLHDLPLYYVLQSIPPECKSNAVWLYHLLYHQPTFSFRNNPIRNIIAYRATTSSELRENLSVCLEKLKAYHYSSVSVNYTIKLVMTMTNGTNYLSYCNRSVGVCKGTPVLAPVASTASPLEDFVLETDTTHLIEVEEEEHVSNAQNVPNATLESASVVTEHEIKVIPRCKVVIRSGSRRGEKCNRECKKNLGVCGIHNYSV